jgi:hypothetical protein
MAGLQTANSSTSATTRPEQARRFTECEAEQQVRSAGWRAADGLRRRAREVVAGKHVADADARAQEREVARPAPMSFAASASILKLLQR